MNRKKCIFIFRRDFRLHDNTALSKCITYDILPVFIFDPIQLNRRVKSNNFVQIMCESLMELGRYIAAKGGHLCLLYGEPHKVVSQLIIKYKPDAVFWNKDYSPYSCKRDQLIRDTCQNLKIDTHSYHDLFVHDFKDLKASFDTRFGTFKKNVFQLPATQPIKITHLNFTNQTFANEVSAENFYKPNPNLAVVPGRMAAVTLLKNSKSMMSSYLKCGTVSIRELWRIADEQLKTKLIWREFYFIAAVKLSHNKDPKVYLKNHYRTFYDARYKNIQWRNDPAEYMALWEGRTGFPAIDAPVRELNKTGFMNNRNRMLVGFFSIKVLRINPFLRNWGGQEYFSKKLIDCSWALNVGNWRWVASDTLDKAGQRFGRGFSGRWMRTDIFERDYVEKWVPEYKSLKPIVDVKQRKKEWFEMTKKQNDM